MTRGAWIGLLLLAGCATDPIGDYCAGYGVTPSSVEYGRCVNHYQQQSAAFVSDRAFCDAQADRTYPKSLYSRPTSFPVRYHGYGGFGRTQMVHVGADYGQIAEVDRLRMTIIEPCMQQQGWNSGASWMAGRHAKTPIIQQPLPWSK